MWFQKSSLLKCKVCGEVPYLGKAKTKFRYRFNNYKSKYTAFRTGNQKVPQKLFHTHYCLDGHSSIEDWDFVIFEQWETHAQLKEREIFWQHRLKTFYPIGLNEKEKYLYWHFFFLRVIRFQLNRNIVFSNFSICFYNLIFPSWCGHFNHFHYYFLKDHWTVSSLINLSGMR